MTQILANFDDFSKKYYKAYRFGSFSLIFVIVVPIVFFKKNRRDQNRVYKTLCRAAQRSQTAPRAVQGRSARLAYDRRG
jgi:hypothetical protein